MPEQLKQIAMRIKELRVIANISVETLAKELKIPIEVYIQYENGEMDIPVSFLYGIAQKFNIELTAILTGGEPRLHIYSLVRKGKGVSVDRRREYKYQSLAYNFIHKKAEPFLVTVDPENSDIPVSLNAHPGQEFNYVLEGALLILIHNQELILYAGDSIFYDSTFRHGMKALDNKSVQFLAVIL